MGRGQAVKALAKESPGGGEEKGQGAPAPPRGGPSSRPSPLPAGAGSPRAGRSRPYATAAAAPSDCWAPGGAALLGGHRLRVPPRRCLRGRAGRARTAGVGTGRRCCWGRHCSADFLFRLRPEDAETPARGTWSPGPRAPPVGLFLGALGSRCWQADECGSGRVSFSFQLPDPDSPQSPGRWGTGAQSNFFHTLFLLGVTVRLLCISVPTRASGPELRALSLNSSAHRQVPVTHT